MVRRRPRTSIADTSIDRRVDTVALMALVGLAALAAEAAGLTTSPVTLPLLTLGSGIAAIGPSILLRSLSPAKEPDLATEPSGLALDPSLVAAVALSPAGVVWLLRLPDTPPYLAMACGLAALGLAAVIIRAQLLMSLDCWRDARHRELTELARQLLTVETRSEAIDAVADALTWVTEGEAAVAVVDTERSAILAGSPALANTHKPTPGDASIGRQASQWDALDTRHKVRLEAEATPGLLLLIAGPGPFRPQLQVTLTQVADQLRSTLDAFAVRTEQTETKADQRFQELAQDSNDLVALVDPDTTTIRFVGPTVERLVGYPEDEFVGRQLSDFVAADDRKLLAKTLAKGKAGPEPRSCDARLRRSDGAYHWFRVSIRRLNPPPPEAVGDAQAPSAKHGLLVSMSDINETKLAEFMVRRAESRYRALVEKSTDVFALVDIEGTIDYLSPNVFQLAGYRHLDLVGTSFMTILSEESAQGVDELLRLSVDQLDGVGVEVELITADGRPLQAQLQVHLPDLQDHNGLLLIVRDITARRRLEENLRSRTIRDQLTGLLTRSAFEVAVQRALSVLGTGERLGVVIVDLHNFREVNNSAGFEVGNELLAKVGERLAHSIRLDDQVARLSSDEFALIAVGRSEEDLVGFAERVEALFDEPFTINGRRWDVRVAIGLAPTTNSQEDPSRMLQAATIAVQQAKLIDATTIAVYNHSLQDRVDERFELMSDMSAAVNDGDFFVAYQPLLSLSTLDVVSFEALLRWNHKGRGPISPGLFIPLAEQSGMIIELGRWVLNRSCRQILDWRAQHDGYQNLSVAVNLSARQLDRPKELDNLLHIIDTTGIDPRSLTVELTESIVIEDPAWLRAQLDRLRSLGVRIAVDDFGTGASGLNHLRELPFDIVKIDKSYIDQVGGGDSGEHLVSQIIELAKGLNATTVAEGIETPQQAEILNEMGCDIGQGFYLAKPMDATRVVEWMANHRAGIVPS